jgi:hypothetical protein
MEETHRIGNAQLTGKLYRFLPGGFVTEIFDVAFPDEYTLLKCEHQNGAYIQYGLCFFFQRPTFPGYEGREGRSRDWNVAVLFL